MSTTVEEQRRITLTDIVGGGGTNVADGERVASAVAGGALVYMAIREKGWGALALGLAGSILAYRGLTGHCPAYGALDISTAEEPTSTTGTMLGRSGIDVRRSITIDRTAEELFDYWRRFENLPTFMKHLKSVTETDETHSTWVASGPLGYAPTWNAEIVEEHPGRLIAWRSTRETQVRTAGLVRFRPTDRGTVVQVKIEYQAPFGRMGAAIAGLFGENPELQVADDLRRFKQLMETGEIATIEGQTSCRATTTSDDEEARG